MSPQHSNSSPRHEQVEPRRRTARSSGASGHRVRTVAGLPTVNHRDQIVSDLGRQDRRELLTAPAAQEAPSGSSARAQVAAAMREPVESDAPLRKVSVATISSTSQHPRWTYVAAGAVAALVCLVATRPMWQPNNGPAPAVIDESTMATATETTLAAPGTPEPAREFVALPASNSPGDLGIHQIEEPTAIKADAPPTAPINVSEIVRREPTSHRTDPRSAHTTNSWLDTVDAETPRVANRPTEPADSKTPKGSPADYPATDYPTLIPPVASGPTDSSQPTPTPASTGNARLDGNIEPIQSDES